MNAESSDPTGGGDLKEAFDIGYDPTSRAPVLGIEGGPITNLWPTDMPDFREPIEKYFSATRDLAHSIFQMLTTGLGVSTHYFDDKVDAPIATMRLIRYPSQAPAGELNCGIGEHCDYECVTILAQDSIGGLQVRSASGEWIDVTPMPNAFVVNIGEMLALWSGGQLKATPHRVINRAGKERFSIPTFFATNPAVSIVPMHSHGKDIKPIIAGEYLLKRLGEIYGVGKQEPQ
jgi:isopenicillin N synthase-like dioxygenase